MKLATLLLGLGLPSLVISQNVGINTDGSIPGMMLHVKVNSGDDGIRIDNNSGTGDALINLQDGGTDAWTFGLDASNGNRFVFDNGGALTTANVLVLETGGDVGIGINNPTANLTVNGDAIFNESGGNNNFRVEGGTNQNVIYVDAANDAFGLLDVPNNVGLIAGTWSQIHGPVEIGSDAGSGDQFTIGYYNASDPLILPERTGGGWGWGYVGDATNYLWYVYSDNFTNVSARETKKQITPIFDDQSLKYRIYSDLDNINPSLYFYKGETHTMEFNNETKYRPMAHLGLILDESPDYLKDGALSGIDIYALATMGVLGAKANKERIDDIESGNSSPIKDFGTITSAGGDLFIAFSNSLNSTNYSVNLTTNNANAQAIVTKKELNGFWVKSTDGEEVTIDYMVLQKTSNLTNQDHQKELSPQQENILTVSPEEQQTVKSYWESNRIHQPKKPQ